MTTYLLANTVTVGNQLYRVARELDDRFDDVPAIRSVGGIVTALPNAAAEYYAGFIRAAQATGRTDWEAYASSLLLSVQKSVRASIEWRIDEAGHGESFIHAHTWSTVERFIKDNDGDCDVYVTGTAADDFTIPATADVQGNARLNFLLSEGNISGNGPIITIEDGAILRNVRQVFVTFRGVFTTQSPFVQDIPGASLQFREGGTVIAQLGSTVSPVNGKVNLTQCVGYFAGNVQSEEPTVPGIYVDADVTFIYAYVQALGSTGMPANQLGSGAGATIVMIGDCSQTIQDQPLVLGTLQVQRNSQDAMMQAVATTTAARPTFNLQVGDRCFDTDLGKPIWWNGADWVDATGTVV